MINLKERLLKLSSLLKENTELFSQQDEFALKGAFIDNPLLNELLTISNEDMLKFDALRDGRALPSPSWYKILEQIKTLTKFNQIDEPFSQIEINGKKKKVHEYSKIYQSLNQFKGSQVYDFGGGVGNLSFFLEKNLAMTPTVLEQDEALIQSGMKKVSKLDSSKVSFKKCLISRDTQIPTIHNDLAIGLHTCGNFATDMMRFCINNNFSKVINFGCCYSKIQDNDYNLSSFSDKSLVFNQRALGYATLGFDEIPIEFYHYRNKIIDYKMSYYHYIYTISGKVEFYSMSNSRRSLFDLSFVEFSSRVHSKYASDTPKLNLKELESFYQSEKNQNLLKYLKAYYALARYFGEAIETYILVDRALFLEENGYQVELKRVFDSKISPRNKGIFAVKS